MDWCRLKTTYYLDPSLLRAGEAAEVLFLRCIAYSGNQESHGRVPLAALPLLCPVKTQPRLDALLREGLLSREGDDVLIAGWEHHQAALDAEVLRRRKERDRKREARKTSAETSADSPGTRAQTDRGTPARKEERREETPTVSPATPATKHSIPDDWQPTLDLLAWARSETPLVNVERETASFVDYFLDKGEKRPGWVRSWKRWMREAQERAEKRTPLRAVPADRFGSWDV